MVTLTIRGLNVLSFGERITSITLSMEHDASLSLVIDTRVCDVILFLPVIYAI